MHLAKFIATYYTHIRILFEMLDIYQFALREWHMTSKTVAIEHLHQKSTRSYYKN